MGFQQADHLCKIQQVPGIGTGKGYAFPVFGCHIQGIIPVCVPQPAEIMGSGFKESGKVLD